MTEQLVEHTIRIKVGHLLYPMYFVFQEKLIIVIYPVGLNLRFKEAYINNEENSPNPT
jgi:hypothetical protein